MGQAETEGLHANQQAYQQCFIGHSQGASWRHAFEWVCNEVLPQFGLKPWYADQHYKGSVPLREKVVEMIATTRYGIYDLSSWRSNEQSAWTMPRNVLIELGIAIALNRPMLLLRHGNNRECGLSLPACLEGIEIGEFSDGKKMLRETLQARLPSLTRHSPQQDWLNRYCHFGGLQCPSREAHPQTQQWGKQKIHLHLADGINPAHMARSDFREVIEEEVLSRFSHLDVAYLDDLTCPPGRPFLLCARCQQVRSSSFAIYRITTHTSADTYIAIGMSLALEKQFSYTIPKILIADTADALPSLLKGYEIIVEHTYAGIRDRLNAILPHIIEEVKQTTWKPQPLPFEVFLPRREMIEPAEEDSSPREDLPKREEVFEQVPLENENQGSIIDLLFPSRQTALPTEERLRRAYNEVREGKITDPETIRRIAEQFERVANDPEANLRVSFDVERAVHSLYDHARVLSEKSKNDPPPLDEFNKRPVNTFTAYAHKDRQDLDKLRAYLSALQRQGLINLWHDGDILVGANIEREIEEHLQTAEIILLLVSADFLNSEFGYGRELQWAMEKHARGTATVIPIILRPCDWKNTPFGRLQALPADGRPVSTWSNQDNAFRNIAEGIRRAVQDRQRRL